MTNTRYMKPTISAVVSSKFIMLNCHWPRGRRPFAPCFDLILASALIAGTIVRVSASCPRYANIRQPAVAEGRWNNSKWARAGPWYVQATNEPSVPNSTLLQCPCNVVRTVHTRALRNTHTHTPVVLYFVCCTHFYASVARLSLPLFCLI